MTFQKQHAKVLRFEISIGEGDAARTLERFEADVRAAIAKMTKPPHNITVHGGYYIIDGKVCLPVDYDPKTKDRKPGTHPPAWAGGPQTSTIAQPAEPEDDRPREFVHVQHSRPMERHPDGRLVRRDKGVKRGPRTRQTKDVA